MQRKSGGLVVGKDVPGKVQGHAGCAEHGHHHSRARMSFSHEDEGRASLAPESLKAPGLHVPTPAAESTPFLERSFEQPAVVGCGCRCRAQEREARGTWDVLLQGHNAKDKEGNSPLHKGKSE